MTKQVALSNEAYAALRGEKQEAESFSDLVLRLMREANMGRRDPMRWLSRPHKSWLTMEEHLQMVEEGREADRRDPWDEDRERQARVAAQARLAGKQPNAQASAES